MNNFYLEVRNFERWLNFHKQIPMTKRFPKLIRYTLFALFFLATSLASAHNVDQSYVYLSVYEDSMEASVQMNIKEINKALKISLDKNFDDLDDFEPHLERLKQYIQENVSLSSPLGAHEMIFKDVELLPLNRVGTIVIMNYELTNDAIIPESLDISYDCFFDIDKTHRMLVLIAHNWKAGILDNEARHSLIFSPKNTQQTLDLSKSSMMTGFIAMIKSGIHHIWIGIDHILFLLALVLPSVVRRREEKVPMSHSKGWGFFRFLNNAAAQWKPVEKYRPAFFYILRIVTFFTIAHSITLSLAALQIINLPGFLVESIIALSIAMAAIHNIYPIFGKREWLIAFVFGLFHGFGFASVLGDQGVGGEFLTLSLLGFNLGVEIGQVAIILGIFPILFFLRKTRFYPFFLIYGSVLLIFISLYWFIERLFGINIGISKPFRWLLKQLR